MARYRLGSICQIISGSTPKTGVQEYWNGDKKWITPAELSESDYIIYDTARKLTGAGVKSAGLTLLPKGTVILSSRAPIGKVAIAGCEMYCNQGFKNLVCTDVINNKYLYWYLRGQTDYLNSLGRGATFKEISKSTVSDIELNVPELTTQIERVAHLEKLQSIITCRRAQLAKLDELVKCRFVEMFGDWHTNSRKLPQCTGRKLFVFSSGKFLSSDKRKESGIPVYGGNGIAWYTAKPLIHEPTIIIGRVGAFCGNVHSTCHPVWVTDNAIYIKQYKKEINHIFLTELMMQMDFHQYADFSGQPKITQKPLEEAKYILPAPEQQQAFATFVLRIDKLRFVIQQSLDETQKLFDSLMQEYFD